MTDLSNSNESMQVVLENAIQGDVNSRKHINSVAHPFIDFQTDSFCRRFCQNNYRQAKCTLSPPQGNYPAAKRHNILCDKANASYAWMLDELTNNTRLNKIEAVSEAQLASYFKTIVNSLPFYERWKNWRFERRIHVPDYICDIHESAKQVFHKLQSGDNTALIAQALRMSEIQAQEIAESILIELTKRRRLYLINPVRTTRLRDSSDTDNSNSDASETEVEDNQYAPERLAYSLQLRAAWKKLDELEQFVIEALVIENQEAQHVLKALETMNISLGKNTSSKENDRQQLYYFKRKSLEKLYGFLS